MNGCIFPTNGVPRLKMRVALVQHPYKMADINGNARRILEVIREAHARDARLVVFPEMAITGYPADDLLLRDDFLSKTADALDYIAAQSPLGIDIIVGAPRQDAGNLYNAAVHIADQRIIHCYYKRYLPNYGVFDEHRHFKVGDKSYVFKIDGLSVGVTVCEDIWYPTPALEAAQLNADLIININASPFDINKREQRDRVLQERVAQTQTPIAYLNRVGGQDELIFDGDSRVISAQGLNILHAPAFDAGVYFFETDKDPLSAQTQAPSRDKIADIRQALIVGLKHYIDDNDAAGVVIGLSGGIDSAVTLALASEALGSARVYALMMPSQYTAASSIEDAGILAKKLDVILQEIPITDLFAMMKQTLKPAFENLPPDKTEENIQARLRGNLLMAIANKHGLMVVGTSNKSEIAMGYTTLYGDSVGAYTPLKDVTKTLVYALAHHYNKDEIIIPQRIIDRPPTAELADGQLDTDSLPPYEVLDPILEKIIDHDASIESLVAEGYPRDVVMMVWRTVLANEYKRRQAPLGPKITPRAFGRERRYPVT
ncbi:MAG: NAD+ synthase, partial [Gammaproteobacteria bacterium]|nr:NAD+ synthase [Gammaproteobacteria bacterium]